MSINIRGLEMIINESSFYYYIEKAAYLNLRSQVLGTNDSLEAKLVNKAYHSARIIKEDFESKINFSPILEPQTFIGIQPNKIKKSDYPAVSLLLWKAKFLYAVEKSEVLPLKTLKVNVRSEFKAVLFDGIYIFKSGYDYSGYNKRE
ncbi:MAG: hypothetical protein Q8K60_04115 [Parachlamydiaceae bacterium]|nr:hypothetical protein [Parachlamydiaceae bacterium]